MLEVKTGLEIKKLTFKFKKDLGFFFKDLNLVCDNHTINFIRGQNGAGKSTLFRLLQGKIYADEQASGELFLDNQKYTLGRDCRSDREFAQQVSLVQQKFDLMLADQLSFQDNLRLAGMSRYPNVCALPKAQELQVLLNDLVLIYKLP